MNKTKNLPRNEADQKAGYAQISLGGIPNENQIQIQRAIKQFLEFNGPGYEQTIKLMDNHNH